MRLLILGIVLATLVWAAEVRGVPPPEAIAAEVIVSGRTSTVKSIAIERTGEQIPETFSGERLKNVEGFTWYVSRHYALQTDFDEGRAKHYLTLLELAYPHYVALFGKEIAGIDRKRMAVVYGASAGSLKRVLEADGILWDFNGGGITYEGFNAAFNYPSGTLQYHQRYIMLHECAHLYQYCLNGTVSNTPDWYYEGVADAVSHHVWDEAGQRLTMNVVDKPTINNWYDDGLAAYAKERFSAGDILNGKRGGRDAGFLLVNFFATDLDRLMRLRIWRDEMFRLNVRDSHRENSVRLMGELFGGKLDEEFEAWMNARRATFHYVDWGWEQEGDALVSYGWPHEKVFSQTDLRLAPGEKAKYDAMVMDYPVQAPSGLGEEIAVKVKRGVEEPVIGCVVNFAANPDRGWAGMGLGVVGSTHVRVLVLERKKLVIDGTDLGAEKVEKDLGGFFGEATAQLFEVGLIIRVGRDELEVTAQGGEGQGAPTVSLALGLNHEQRERILGQPVAVLSVGGRHRINVFADDARRAEPDLDVAAPANRWRFAFERELYAAERAVWRLGASAPQSLGAFKQHLLAGKYDEKEMLNVQRDIEKSGASAELIEAALGELKKPRE